MNIFYDIISFAINEKFIFPTFLIGLFLLMPEKVINFIFFFAYLAAFIIFFEVCVDDIRIKISPLSE